MAVDKEAICLSRVYSYYYKYNLPLQINLHRPFGISMTRTLTHIDIVAIGLDYSEHHELGASGSIICSEIHKTFARNINLPPFRNTPRVRSAKEFDQCLKPNNFPTFAFS